MKVLIHRTMRLGGERVVAGDIADVPDDDANLALKHGWASVPAAKAAKGKAVKAEPGAPVEAAAE